MNPRLSLLVYTGILADLIYKLCSYEIMLDDKITPALVRKLKQEVIPT
jgi:hypothetical protein